MTIFRVSIRRIATAGLLATAVTLPASAQGDSASRASGQYFGPRIGVTWLSPAVLDSARDRVGDIAPIISQFGWQWETRFDPGAGAPILASAFVLVVGGAEQGVVLPSLSWLLGIRGAGGGEFGIGPVASLSGVNLAIALGVTKRYGEVYVPWNIVIVTGKPGPRVSFLTGFNMNRKRLQ